MKTIWLFMTNWVFQIWVFILFFISPAWILDFLWLGKTMGSEQVENGKAGIYFIICIICTPITLGIPFAIIEYVDKKLSVSFEERYNS